jgi:vacuolar-type H+-ATPase subunit I/STV1
MNRAKTLMLVICALLVAGPAAAQKLYKYVDSEGRVRYTDRPPIDMTGRASEQLNQQGTVIRRNAAAPTAEELAAREEERKRQLEAEAAAREERRKNLALLATYPSLQDLEEAQARALGNNAEATKQVQMRIAELQKRQQKLEADAEFHKGKPLPLLLKRDIFDVEADLRAQSDLLEVKKREVDAINARYGEDKRRYLEITKSGGASAAAATQATPAAKR